MEIIPPVGDMRYESFLDKSKQDIESSGLVLGGSLFISSKPLLGFHKLGSKGYRNSKGKATAFALETPVISVLMDKDSGQYKGVRLASGQDLFSHQLVLDPTFTVTLAPTSSPPNLLREDLQVLSLKDGRKGKVARGICITSSSLKPDISNCVLVCPPRSLCPEQDTSIRIIQICGSLEMDVCPKGICFVYVTMLTKFRRERS
ncbi:hypothetical protein L3X38_009149 [Prunus dulcis]|uniref:Uncharacterized protein n=1 Tax=Prunus dulcis TaxID=3755 RepID=A0AAD5F7P8_PRUDU|nr:hypothetical protein L3X38_009149 [Prunus dulcis]